MNHTDTTTEENKAEEFLNWYGRDRWKYARKTGGVSIETIEQYVQHRLSQLAEGEVPREEEVLRESNRQELIIWGADENEIPMEFKAHIVSGVHSGFITCANWMRGRLAPKIAALKGEIKLIKIAHDLQCDIVNHQDVIGKRLIQETNTLENEVAQLRADNDRMSEALRTYAVHLADCQSQHMDHPCDCGYSEALSSLPQDSGDKNETVDPGEFAEWLHLNDWSACSAIGSKDVSWMNLDNEYDPEQHGLPDKEFFTTAELKEMYKLDKQKT